MSASGEFADYSRTMPPEWDGLVRDFSAQLELAEQQGGDVRERVAPTALDVVESMDDEALEANRYYALGKIACGFARHIATPEARQHIVESVGAGLRDVWSRHDEPRAPGLSLADVNEAQRDAQSGEPGFDEVLKGYAYAGYYELSRAEQLTADVLSTEAESRIAALHYPENAFSRETKLSTVVEQALSVETVATAALSGALTVFRVAGRKHKDVAYVEEGTLRVAELLEPETKEKLNLQSNAKMAAGIRLDEIRGRLASYVTLTDDGEVRWNRQAVPLASQLAPSIFSLHAKRLKCPALHVRGLIPYIVDLMVDSLAEADRLTNER